MEICLHPAESADFLFAYGRSNAGFQGYDSEFTKLH